MNGVVKMHNNVQNALLLNITDVAEVLGLSYWTVRKLTLSGQIKGFKINGRWKIPMSSVESFMRDSEDESNPDTLNISQSDIQNFDKIVREIMGGSDE